MKSKLYLRLVAILLCASLAVFAPPAKASIPSGTQVAGIIVAIVAVGAAIGVGTYYLVRKAPSVTGCAVSSPNGLQLQNEGDQQVYTLIGDMAGITVGDRIRVKGKKKKTAAGKQSFLVDELKKDYGSCQLHPATHN